MQPLNGFIVHYNPIYFTAITCTIQDNLVYSCLAVISGRYKIPSRIIIGNSFYR